MISHLLAGLAAFSVARASPHALSRRGTVASDEIVGLPQTVPSGTVGEVYLAYQPDLYVVNGCVPFPGVDAAGNTKLVAFLLFYYLVALTEYKISAGLKPTGGSSDGCSSSTGQIYGEPLP
jgi:hypothetical protein